MDKNVKNVLAAVGAVAVVKTMPLLALGAAIGAVATDPKKVTDTIDKARDHLDMLFVKYGMDVSGEDECECCCGGKCDCEEECCCDLSSEEDAQPSENEEATFEGEPEVNVAPAEETYGESAYVEEEEMNPSEAGNWTAT